MEREAWSYFNYFRSRQNSIRFLRMDWNLPYIWFPLFTVLPLYLALFYRICVIMTNDALKTHVIFRLPLRIDVNLRARWLKVYI